MKRWSNVNVLAGSGNPYSGVGQRNTVVHSICIVVPVLATRLHTAPFDCDSEHINREKEIGFSQKWDSCWVSHWWHHSIKCSLVFCGSLWNTSVVCSSCFISWRTGQLLGLQFDWHLHSVQLAAAQREAEVLSALLIRWSLIKDYFHQDRWKLVERFLSSIVMLSLMASWSHFSGC